MFILLLISDEYMGLFCWVYLQWQLSSFNECDELLLQGGRDAYFRELFFAPMRSFSFHANLSVNIIDNFLWNEYSFSVALDFDFSLSFIRFFFHRNLHLWIVDFFFSNQFFNHNEIPKIFDEFCLEDVCFFFLNWSQIYPQNTFINAMLEVFLSMKGIFFRDFLKIVIYEKFSKCFYY